MSVPDSASVSAGDNGSDSDSGNICPGCGAHNRAGAAFCRDCATALVATKSKWDRRTRRRAVSLSTVLVLVIASWLTFSWVQDTWYSAGDPVVDYFAGLQAREGYEPPENVRIGGVTRTSTNWEGECKRSTCYPDGDHATVTVTYELAGETYTGGVVVTRPSTGWFREWSVVEPRGLLRVNATGHLPVVDVAGQTVATQREARYAQNEFASLPPGVYTVTVEHPLLEAEAQTVRVPIAGGSDAWRSVKTQIDMPTPTIKESAAATVEQMVRQRVDECMAVTGDSTPGCWIQPKTSMVDEATVSWELESYPTIEVRLADSPHWDDPPVEIVTTVPGKATMHFQRIRSDKDRTETVEFKVYGDIDVEDGQIVWST